MKQFLLLFLTCVCAVVCAQAQTDAASDSIIYNSCDVMPEFPGGNAAMMRYIGEHLQYPETALKAANKENAFCGSSSPRMVMWEK